MFADRWRLPLRLRHVTTNAASTGVVGGCSGRAVCGGTLQALYEAAKQVGWVLTPAGLWGLSPPGRPHAGPVRAGSEGCCCRLSWDCEKPRSENWAPPWLWASQEAWSWSSDKSEDKEGAGEGTRREKEFVMVRVFMLFQLRHFKDLRIKLDFPKCGASRVFVNAHSGLFPEAWVATDSCDACEWRDVLLCILTPLLTGWQAWGVSHVSRSMRLHSFSKTLTSSSGNISPDQSGWADILTVTSSEPRQCSKEKRIHLPALWPVISCFMRTQTLNEICGFGKSSR